MATKAHLEGNKRYLDKLDEMKIRVPKGKKELIQDMAASVGKSLNGYVNGAIDEKMERDNDRDDEM